MTARGAFDVRLWIEAETEAEAWALAKRFVERSRLVAPVGVEPRYVQLRPADRSRSFPASMSPKRRRSDEGEAA